MPFAGNDLLLNSLTKKIPFLKIPILNHATLFHKKIYAIYKGVINSPIGVRGRKGITRVRHNRYVVVVVVTIPSDPRFSFHHTTQIVAGVFYLISSSHASDFIVHLCTFLPTFRKSTIQFALRFAPLIPKTTFGWGRSKKVVFPKAKLLADVTCYLILYDRYAMCLRRDRCLVSTPRTIFK